MVEMAALVRLARLRGMSRTYTGQQSSPWVRSRTQCRPFSIGLARPLSDGHNAPTVPRAGPPSQPNREVAGHNSRLPMPVANLQLLLHSCRISRARPTAPPSSQSTPEISQQLLRSGVACGVTRLASSSSSRPTHPRACRQCTGRSRITDPKNVLFAQLANGRASEQSQRPSNLIT